MNKNKFEIKIKNLKKLDKLIYKDKIYKIIRINKNNMNF